MTTPAAKWKAAERARHKEAGRVAVTVNIYPEDREKLARYIKRLNDRAIQGVAGRHAFACQRQLGDAPKSPNPHIA